MNKYFKAYGKGMIWGATHPFTDVNKTNRYDNMSLSETACDALGVGLIQTGIIYGIFIAGLIAIGYANNKIKNQPVKVKMVVDNTPNKK